MGNQMDSQDITGEKESTPRCREELRQIEAWFLKERSGL